MSGADFEAMEHWDLGLGRVPDKMTCSRHINDPAVKRFILEQAVRGTCDLCGRYNTKVVPLEQLMRFLLEVVGHFYTDPANFMQYETREGGYRGTVYDGWEVIGENFQLEMDDLIFEDIRASINLERPWADEAEYYGDQADFLRYHWDYFKKVVKHRSRYLFGQTSDLRSEDYHVKPYDILTGIGRDTFKYGLVRTLPAGSSILRCRQHTPELRVTTAAQISSPPEQFAISPNRMSPAGISMFYGAFDAATCVLETIDRGDTVKTHYTLATFQNRHPLQVVDLSLIPPVPSVFDRDKWEDYYPIIFMRDLTEDFSRPIERDQRVHIEYVPTQIVTEFYRYAFIDSAGERVRIDGLIYPSSRNRGKNACVLFFDDRECLEELAFVPEQLVRKKIRTA